MFISILLSMHLNDFENYFIQKGADGFDTGMLKLYLLLSADDRVIFAESSEGLKIGLNILAESCRQRKLTVNTDKTKIMIFKKRVIYQLLFKVQL